MTLRNPKKSTDSRNPVHDRPPRAMSSRGPPPDRALEGTPMTTRNVTSRAFLAVLVLLLASVLPAQCFSGDDGFDAACCTLPAPVLPAFNAVTVLSEYGALLACHQTFAIPPFPVTFSAPWFAQCDYAIINVNAQLGGGVSLSGMLLAKYSRTWQDFSSPVLGQVYRFLVNGDLAWTSGTPVTPCTTILPRCAAVNPTIHFDGHIDYSCDPFNPFQFTLSFSLNHLQGCLSHAPWSCTPLPPLVNHDEVSYHLVGPAPFTFGTGFQAPQGAITGEAVRTSYLRLAGGFSYACNTEAKTANIPGNGFILTTQAPHCGCLMIDQCSSMPLLCMTPPGGCYAQQQIFGTTCCPMPTNVFQGLPIGGTPVNQTGFLSQTVGSWGPGPGYPYNGNLTTYFGVLTYNDPCGLANWGVHAVVGVCTSNVFGQPFNTNACGAPVGFTTAYLDLQNCLVVSNPILPPGYGCVSGCDIVWNIDL